MTFDADDTISKRPPRPAETKKDRRRRHEEKQNRHEAKRQRREARAAYPPSVPPPPLPFDDVAPAVVPDASTFVWRKKVELQRRRGEPVAPDDDVRRRRELAHELEAAKRRRAERDAERAAWEVEQANVAREREQVENAGWHRAEQSFHGNQHFLRQAIRLRQARPVGTDQLATNVRLDLLDVNPDVLNPVARLRNMDLVRPELEQLVEDVEKELDYIPDFTTDEDSTVFNRGLRIAWWESIKVVVRTMLHSPGLKYGDAEGVHDAVQTDLDALLHGKSLNKLLQLECEISNRLEGNGNDSTNDSSAVDDFAEIDFWTSALTRIRFVIAELRLADMTNLLAEERRKRLAAMPKEGEQSARDGIEKSADGSSTELDMIEREAARGMGPDEEKFSDEVELSKRRQTPAAGYGWNDKYRPRKPRYYNRVHTGYDWTKYNRTHYDSDNPPPKTVQGYRFNIFYPDLIDPSKTPTYSISKTDNPEVCIITFKAGPPYEDLAFKIVNRPWEHSHRRGYRCSFDRGILHMWFNFQRYRYRR